MTTTTEYQTRLPQRQAALNNHGRNVRDRNAALGPDNLFAALTVTRGRGRPGDHVGARWARKALHEMLGWEPSIEATVRIIEEAFPDQVEARREREAAEAAEAEKRRKAAAREPAKAREAAAEQDKLRRAVEAARQRRQAEHEAELEAEARRTLAEA